MKWDIAIFVLKELWGSDFRSIQLLLRRRRVWKTELQRNGSPCSLDASLFPGQWNCQIQDFGRGIR